MIFEDDSEDRTCIDGALWLSRDAYAELEKLAAEHGESVLVLTEGVMQSLGKDPELLRIAAGVSEPQLEPEVIGMPWWPHRGR